MSLIKTIEGTIKKIIVNKHEAIKSDIFIKAVITTEDGEEILICGPTQTYPQIGDFIRGNFINVIHPTFGSQLKATGQIELSLPRDPFAIIKRCKEISKKNGIDLTPGIISIITEYAKGPSFWTSIQTHQPKKTMLNLTRLKFIKLQELINTYINNKTYIPGVVDLERYFMDIGLTWTSNAITKMIGYTKDGEKDPEKERVILTTITRNPLAIIEVMEHIKVSQFLEFLSALFKLKSISESQLAIGKILVECTKAEQNGDSCIKTTPFYSTILKEYDLTCEYLTEYCGFIYRTTVLKKEQKIAAYFVKASTKPFLHHKLIDNDLIDEFKETVKDQLESLKNIKCLTEDATPKTANSEQLNAVLNILTSNLSTIQGSAGTGKTTALQLLRDYVLCISPEICKHIVFLAPTGKAVDRIGESLKNGPFNGEQIMTIHRFYYSNKECENEKKHKEYAEAPKVFEPFITEPFLIIVDESSMISTDVMALLITAINTYETLPHVCFMGDVFQLDPVGYGNPFMDLITSGIAPNTTLSVIHRQGPGSKLSQAIYEIRNAINLTVSEPGEFEVSFIRNIEAPMIRWIESHHDKDFMIIAPTGKKGLVGTLTPIIREIVNPANVTSNIIINGVVLDKYRIGDRIIQKKNNKVRRVYNGSVGIIIRSIEVPLNEREGVFDLRIVVKFKSEEVLYTLSELEEETEFAYAITAHKSQGSEYKHVLIIMDRVIPGFINRKLIYTAASRGKESVKIMITDHAIIDSWKMDSLKRLTMLPELIKETYKDVK